jgi:hypothetical protein
MAQRSSFDSKDPFRCDWYLSLWPLNYVHILFLSMESTSFLIASFQLLYLIAYEKARGSSIISNAKVQKSLSLVDGAL